MEILKTLAVVLSIGSLAGLNLYLTVFVSGLAMRFDWVTLPPSLNGLEVLGHPIVIALAGILYLFEFLQTKSLGSILPGTPFTPSFARSALRHWLWRPWAK